METNLVTIILLGVTALVVGGIWYGPLFGKKWLEVTGATDLDIEKRKEMQKQAMPLYVIQFLLVLLQVYVLGSLLAWGGWGAQGLWVAFFMWLGFVVPTLAGSAMWNNNPTKVKWAMFLIQGGYQLVMFLIFGWALSQWG